MINRKIADETFVELIEGFKKMLRRLVVEDIVMD